MSEKVLLILLNPLLFVKITSRLLDMKELRSSVAERPTDRN